MGVLPQRYEPSVDLSTLVPHPDNPRRGDLNEVVSSIQRIGFYGTLVCQESSRHICAGHTRRLAAMEDGETHLPVVFVDCDDDTAREILAADNGTSDLATYDPDALAALLSRFDSLDGLGFPADRLAALALPQTGSEQTVDDDAPAVDETAHDPELGDLIFRVVVDCESEAQQTSVLDALIGAGYGDQATAVMV